MGKLGVIGFQDMKIEDLEMRINNIILTSD